MDYSAKSQVQTLNTTELAMAQAPQNSAEGKANPCGEHGSSEGAGHVGAWQARETKLGR